MKVSDSRQITWDDRRPRDPVPRLLIKTRTVSSARERVPRQFFFFLFLSSFGIVHVSFLTFKEITHGKEGTSLREQRESEFLKKFQERKTKLFDGQGYRYEISVST